jgi:2-polyprenyl-3-methyl-5-hydroxy-6-metoxy-1,4-benzoquinol methylase
MDAVTNQQLISGYGASALGIDVEALLGGTAGPVELIQCEDCGVKWYANAPAGDAAFYVALQKHEWYYESDKSEYAFARRHVAAGDRVLEVGCGRGAFHSHLDANVVYRGLEFNQSAVDLARAAGLNVEICDLKTAAEMQSGQYDVVCHFQVLEHVSDPFEFMRDSARVLKPGGRLLVAVPAEDSFIGLAESSWLNMPPHHLTRWTDKALQAAFVQAGVEPTESWHEQVSALHKAWHRKVVANAGWLSLFGRAPMLAGGTDRMRLLRLAKRIPGLEALLYKRGCAVYPHAARGHTLCIVGVKR